MGAFPQPASNNGFLAAHVNLLRSSLKALTGCDLLDGGLSGAKAARAVFEAPFVVLSHDRSPDPVLTYGNRKALELFQLSWTELTAMPSRLTAESPNREERARLLARVTADGYIDDYSGIRVSRMGRRFLIERATVWNLMDHRGAICGQAATFSDWRLLPS